MDKTLNIYDLFEQAKQYSNDGNFDLALKFLLKCDKCKRLKNDALFERIKIFYELKNYDKVIKYSKKFLKLKVNKRLKNIIKIILAKSYKVIGNTDKAILILDTIKSKEQYSDFSGERIDCSYSKFNDFFRVHEFSGNVKEMQQEFKIIKKLEPQNKKQLFYISRVSNFFHNYSFTKELINKNKFNYIDLFYDNAILNEFEIASKKVVLESKPRSMWIATSSKCNIKCEMCMSNDINWSLSKKDIQDIYSYMPYLEQIVWWGGEPTISNTFYEMLSCSLKYNNIKHTIITNGQYMPQKFIDIVSQNNMEVVFSIDSVNKKRYESVRKGASFDKLIENLSKLSRVLNNNLIKINVVAMKDTIKELHDIYKFADKYNIKTISFIPLCGDKMLENKLSKIDIKTINKNSKNNYNVKVFNSSDMLKKDKKEYKTKGFCHIPWGDITFSYMGFLCNDNNCSFLGEDSYKLTKDNMAQYWNSDICINMRKKILKTHYCSKYCPKVSRNIL